MPLDKRHAPSRKITKWTSPLLKLCAQGQSWITQCYVMAMLSITQAQALEIKISAKFTEEKGAGISTLSILLSLKPFLWSYSALSRPSSIWSSFIFSTLKNNVPLASVLCVFVTDGDTLCQNISEFLCSSLAVSLAQTGSCLFILCCLEGLATLAEKIPSLTRWR